VVTGKPATSAEPRLVLVDGTGSADVFELIDVGNPTIVARAPFLFEVGEELHVRLDGRDLTVRVLRHRPDGVTELEPAEAI
jgi:hypothetical protein